MYVSVHIIEKSNNFKFWSYDSAILYFLIQENFKSN